jgi:lysozyme
MKVTPKAIELIKMFEGFEPNAYPDPATGAEPYTIGFGTTRYPDGKKVKLGDTCTPEQAEEWLKHYISNIHPGITRELNDNQLSAIASFIYNLGISNWKTSTLRRKINTDPSDPSIAAEFKKWNKAGGKIMKGLTRRRAAEATVYFS